MFQNLIILVAMYALSACGRNNDNAESSLSVVGGNQVTSPADPVYASTVALVGNASICSGTIIGPNHILTAAHCLAGGDQYRIGYGPNATSAGVQIVGSKIHPSYNGDLNDIALIVFQGTLPAGLRPVGIAPTIATGMPIVVAGYGITGEGRNDSGLLRKTESQIGQTSPTTRQFAQITGRGQGSCSGDSGGPGFLNNGTGYVLGGVLVSGSNNCNVGDGVYTDATKYQGWMKCTFAQLGAPLNSLLDDASMQECNMATNNLANLGRTQMMPGMGMSTMGGNANILAMIQMLFSRMQ